MFVAPTCRNRFFAVLATCSMILPAGAQQPRHGRGYKAPPPTAQVSVTVEKGFNRKPLPNASVVFRAVRDEKITANLETKTDPDGKASLDLLEVGSHVTIQVIATGFATYATDFDLSDQGREILVKLERPRAQISHYGENEDRPAAVQPGVQEHQAPSSKPQGAQPLTPQTTAPQTATPQATPPSTTSPEPVAPAPGTSPVSSPQ